VTEIIVAVIGAFGGTLLGFILNELKAKRSEQEALKILLRRELRTQYNEWHNKGYITESALIEYTYALDVYERLVGKNDFVEQITKGISCLEVRS